MPVQHQSNSTVSRVPGSIGVALILCFSAPQLLAEESSGQEMAHGEMAGIIRSADHPCAHVLDLQTTGESAWNVTCNSGGFFVKRDGNGNYTVNPSG